MRHGRGEPTFEHATPQNIQPADASDEPLFGSQWHLSSSLGFDINVESVWDDYTGAGISVVVIDTGIQLDHPDLAANIDPINQIDSPPNEIGAGEGAPKTSSDNHGTAVAGVIAAQDNGIGGVGVAYEATLVSAYTPLQALGQQSAGLAYSEYFDISNNSWGGVPGLNDPFPDNFFGIHRQSDAAIIAEVAEDGRSGLGSIFVFSAGNGAEFGDDVNQLNFQNSRYTIAVGATKEDGEVATFSNPGAALLVSAPGEGIVTTDRTGSDGYESGDSTTIDGTSFAAPIISGVTALMLEANAGLGARDVQEIYAVSSRTIDPLETQWQTNGADWWNGGGLTWSHSYGSGLVDTHAAVRLAETWFGDEVFGTGDGTAATFNNESVTSKTYSSNFSIPDNNTTGVSRSVTITDDFEVEQIELHLQVTHPFIIDLVVELTSPDGTTVTLLDNPQSLQSNFSFVFSSTFFWGEMSSGTWTLTVIDNTSLFAGTVTNWELTIYGDADSSDDTFLYTNEFGATFKDDNTARRTLTDASGEDTINVAAIDLAGSEDTTINLNPGTVSTIAGQSLTIASGTVIEHAIAGDGDDTLTGNSADNSLFGGRGNDTVLGGAGDDLLLGGRGNDELDGGSGNDTLLGGAGNDQLDGGSGDDTASFADATAGVSVDLGIAGSQSIGGGLGSDQLTNIDNLIGSGFNDTLTGFGGANHIDGGDGDDLLAATAETCSSAAPATTTFLRSSAAATSPLPAVTAMMISHRSR